MPTTMKASALRYSREKVTLDLVDELRPLLEKHWDEVAHPAFKDIQKLNPAFEKYMQMDQAGQLRVFTARALDGALVGYWVFFVNPNLHYQDTIQAAGDVLFFDPSFRGHGGDFMKWCFDQLKDEGIDIVHVYMKKAKSFAPFLERMGFEQIDLHYTKRLD